MTEVLGYADTENEAENYENIPPQQLVWWPRRVTCSLTGKPAVEM